VLPAIEEFGIASVEAQAAGRPVIAAHGGGALETVVEGSTGAFFDGGPDELATTVLEFDDRGVDPQACVANAGRFTSEVFAKALPREVERAVAAASSGVPSVERAVAPRARRGRRTLTRRPG
jgi:glycosyltransferase involved in cell wall biosynthesis